MFYLRRIEPLCLRLSSEKHSKKRERGTVPQGPPVADPPEKPQGLHIREIVCTENFKSIIGDSNDKLLYQSHISDKNHNKIIKLIGKICTITCFLQNTKQKALFDTGAQVSVISTSHLRNSFPHERVRNISELLGSDANLDLKTANGSSLPYIGYVVLLFTFEEGEPGIKVPILVTNSILDLPIIGYNVLEETRRNNYKSA